MRYLTISSSGIILQILLATTSIAGDLQGYVKSKADRVMVAIRDVKGIFLPPDSSVVMDQKNMRFIPTLLPVQKGTTVYFPNNEISIYHNIFSLSAPKIFDLGTYRAGEQRSVTFDTTGVVEIFCTLHTRMYAVVSVLDNPYYSLCDNNGQFSIKDIPAGNYTVNAILVYTGKQKYVSEYRNISIPPDGTTTLTIEID